MFNNNPTVQMKKKRIWVRIHDPAAKLDHAKREIVAARFFEITAEAVLNAAKDQRDCS